MAIVVTFAISASVYPCAAETCIYDSVPLCGAWEMSYRSNAWDSAECPQFKGVAVANAVPGFWVDMVPALRSAGMKDTFRINPAYVPQTIPITKSAKCTTLPNIYGCFLYRRRFTLEKLPQRPASLAFDCVRNQVHAWVNGRFVAFRQGFSTPFELPIPSGALREGENEIVLAVSNNPNKGYNGSDVSGLTTRALFESTGGIDGRLELRFARNGLRDVYVTTAKDLKSFTVHLITQRPGQSPALPSESCHEVPNTQRRLEDKPPYHAYVISDERGQTIAKGEGRGDDLYIYALLFRYGRYLLISSSQPGTQAANLQGIWNKDMSPAWRSNYTININTQMNYWPAEVTGLGDLAEPLWRLCDELAVTGGSSPATHAARRAGRRTTTPTSGAGRT